MKLPEKYFTFQVTGTGPFPLDMLRYDQCWPMGSEDAAAIEASVTRYTKAYLEPHEVGRVQRDIKLTGHKAIPQPTVGRWESFGWHVTGYKAVQS